MTEINVRDARRRFKEILDRAAAGEEISILRHGEPVALLGPPRPSRRALPPLASFRGSIRRGGAPSSEDVVAARDQERY